MLTRRSTGTPMSIAPAPQQVVVVSNHPQMSNMLHTVLDAGNYDVVVVESMDHAYSHIKRVAPHLVVVCLDIDDLAGFQVLSMLKLDSVTRSIPLVTCTVTLDRTGSFEPPDTAETAFAQPLLPTRMH